MKSILADHLLFDRFVRHTEDSKTYTVSYIYKIVFMKYYAILCNWFLISSSIRTLTVTFYLDLSPLASVLDSPGTQAASVRAQAAARAGSLVSRRKWRFASMTSRVVSDDVSWKKSMIYRPRYTTPFLNEVTFCQCSAWRSYRDTSFVAQIELHLRERKLKTRHP